VRFEIRRRSTLATLAAALAATAATATLPVAAPASSVAPQAEAVSAATHATNSGRVQETTYRVTPKVQRTVRFTGYATYTFNSPAGRKIVEASALIIGGQKHAVRIASRTIASNRASYTVKLVFPGEQGKPGKLLVRLLTIA
jgi:hypothetical protein